MDTAALKSFAAWARTTLRREVAARIAVVLAPGSAERIDQSGAVAALEAAIGTAGGGDCGREAVTDTVACTWFTRIITLRFMDANGYTMPFLFEPEDEGTELLIRSNLLADDSVPARAATVLTEEVCREVEVIGWLYQFYLSERKDEIFARFKRHQKAGAPELPAATQLFTPRWIVRYLVENSLGRLWLLNRPASRLADQLKYYLAPVDEQTDYLKVAGPEELKVIDPACGSGHMLTYAFDLLYAIYEEEGYAPSDIPGLILANNLYGIEIDPRAGALAEFALTMKARARQGPFFGRQIRPNICVLEPISFTADELDALVTIPRNRATEANFWNQFQNADTFGSLIRPSALLFESLRAPVETLAATLDHPFPADVGPRADRVLEQSKYLVQRYDVVVTNPPYMGSANMSALLSAWLAREYPTGKGDLMTAFMVRSEAFVRPGGCWAMINIPTWMFLAGYQKLRVALLRDNTIESMLHLGRGAFGADFGSVAFVVRTAAPKPAARAVYRRLFDQHVDIRTNDQIESLFHRSDYQRFVADQAGLSQLPGSQIAYWARPATLRALAGPPLTAHARPMIGIQSGNNREHYRFWHEVSDRAIRRDLGSLSETGGQDGRVWVPLQRGGDRRRWFGNVDSVVDLSNSGRAILQTTNGSLRNSNSYFGESVTWNRLSNGRFYPRYVDSGTVFDDLSPFLTATTGASIEFLLGLLASGPARLFVGIFNQGRKTEVGHVASLPWPTRLVDVAAVETRVRRLVEIARADWNRAETSLGFGALPMLEVASSGSVERWLVAVEQHVAGEVAETIRLERQNDQVFIDAYGLGPDLPTGLTVDEVTLRGNPSYRYGGSPGPTRRRELARADLIRDLISYAVGCMFGRYSLDRPGLILGNQGESLSDYLAKVPHPSFRPGQNNVIPIVDGDWFEDDVVTRFRQFLQVVFGEQHLEENLRFVTRSLGVKDLRNYFVKSFYKDHVRRYKKRPIYWLFSSPNGSFNALIYVHRYTPSLASTVLSEYLREFKSKVEAGRRHQERLAAGTGSPREQATALKEVSRLRKVLLELDDYEHDALSPLATGQLQIDLDDGVRANYLRFGAALKEIPGL